MIYSPLFTNTRLHKDWARLCAKCSMPFHLLSYYSISLVCGLHQANVSASIVEEYISIHFIHSRLKSFSIYIHTLHTVVSITISLLHSHDHNVLENGFTINGKIISIFFLPAFFSHFADDVRIFYVTVGCSEKLVYGGWESMRR